MKEKAVMIIIVVIMLLPEALLAEPRNQKIKLICGSELEHNSTLYVPNFIATMVKVSTQLQVSGFGLASTGFGPDRNYGLTQCYGDLSLDDCTICYAEARTALPGCYPANGGRIYLDGCFMRFENYSFYEEFTGPNDHAECGNITRPNSGFRAAVGQAMSQAVASAERSNGYGRAEVAVAGRRNESAYVLADCWRSISASSCRACLENATASVSRCLPASEGRALNTGCFMRYSDTNFLNPIPRNGSSREIVIVIVVAAISAAVVITIGAVIGFITWKNRTIEKKRRGNAVKLVKTLNDRSLNYESFPTLDLYSDVKKD